MAEDKDIQVSGEKIVPGNPTLIGSDWVELPVGIEHQGQRIRKVRVDEMSGVDEENMGMAQYKNNPGRVITILLRRAIQEVPGIVPTKSDPDILVDEYLVQRMYQADRDALVRGIYVLSPDVDTTDVLFYCPVCDVEWEEELKLADVGLKMWPEDKATVIPFRLERGVVQNGVTHVDGELTFPTGKVQEIIAPFSQTNQALATTKLLYNIIKKIGDATLTEEVIKHLRSTDRRLLNRILMDELPGLDLKTRRKHDCGEECERVLRLQDFLLSARKSKSA